MIDLALVLPNSITGWVQLGIDITFAASLIHAFLPPFEIFNDFPGFQKYYKLLINIVSYIAINVRTNVVQLYQNVDTAKEAQKNAN